MMILERHREVLEKVGQLEEPLVYFEDCYTCENPNAGVAEVDIVVALIIFNGNYRKCAAALRRTRNFILSHVERNDELRELRSDIREGLIDDIEELVFEQARSGDGTQARFVLQTQAKERGYVSREERTGKDGKPMESKIDFSQFDDETLRKFLDGKV
jgi:hypothetical protein